MFKTVKILGIPFINTNMDELVNYLDSRLAKSQKTFLVTANPEILMYAKENSGYHQILEKADIVTPDGIGVLIGSKILKNPIQERLTGYDLVLRLFELSSQKGYKVYFLGAKPDVIEEAAAKIKAQYPGLNLVGYHHGYFDFNDETIVKDIQEKAPDILLVGLGFPRQEEWITHYEGRLEKGLMIGVGGSFDGFAGRVKRAPLIWQKLNVEWLYRLIRQPSRWRRMLVLPHFLFVMSGQRPKKK